ncbi:MAG: glycoside hydrolase family 88 protein [Gloeobacteraceae cyanobacterium ES-bin-144]|nr:glycoside hydrolase family 88 protein [Verrucomicrobiales bacterium]
MLALPVFAESPHSKFFSDWPAGSSPKEVGKKVAENFIPRKFRYETQPNADSNGLIYQESTAWYGSLTYAKLADDKDLDARLVKKFEPFLSEPGLSRITRTAHVDFRVIGIIPLEIFIQTNDPRCKDLGLSLADAQWETTNPDGITTEARYWIDDMYMIPMIQVQAFRATQDSKYLDRAALTMCAYLDRLQEANGLFFHGIDSKFYWGRGNGWMAAGFAELLRTLPKDHSKHARILAGYHKMMAGLLANQDDTGMWRQLIDKPASWPETSGTAMFTFAMVTGVKNGWLDEDTYGPAARKAWLSLVGYLDENANLREVCIGTNKGFDEKYYNDRPRIVGDLHGQSPVLWTASALLR